MSRRKPRNRPQPVLPAVIIPALQGDAEWAPTYSLNRHIAETRHRVGEARWAELNAEWL